MEIQAENEQHWHKLLQWFGDPLQRLRAAEAGWLVSSIDPATRTIHVTSRRTALFPGYVQEPTPRHDTSEISMITGLLKKGILTFDEARDLTNRFLNQPEDLRV